MQVVLWKPPGNFVREVIKDVDRGVPSPTMTSSGDASRDMTDGPIDVPDASMETVQAPSPALR